MKGLVLAAGRGSRINNVTKGNNKCLISIDNKSIISYTVEKLCSLDEISECIVVVGYKAEDIKKCIGNEVNGKKIIYCFQQEQKGLIDAIEVAGNSLDDDDFFMVLGDEFVYEDNYKLAIEEFKQSKFTGLIGIIKVEDIDLVKKTYTFDIDKYMNMIGFIEKPKQPLNNYMGTGNVIFSGKVLDLLKKVPVNHVRGERELVGLFNLMIEEEEKMSAFIVGSEYINLNTSNDLELIQKILNKKCIVV